MITSSRERSELSIVYPVVSCVGLNFMPKTFIFILIHLHSVPSPSSHPLPPRARQHMKVKKIQFPTKKYTNQTNPRPHSQKEDQKHLSKKEGGGSHNPPMNLKPNDKRNRKTTPSASDSSRKPKQS